MTNSELIRLVGTTASDFIKALVILRDEKGMNDIINPLIQEIQNNFDEISFVMFPDEE
jgi:hypothetical protein